MKKRMAIVGAGAVGCYLGGHLARAGNDITLIDSWPEHIEAIRAHYGPRNKNHRINWDRTIVEEPLDWTFEQLENGKLGAMIERAGYPGITADLDMDKIAAVLPALKKRAYEMYAEGERLTGHKGLPLEFTANLAAE